MTTTIKLITAAVLTAAISTSAHADDRATRIGVGASGGYAGFGGYDGSVAAALATASLHAEVAAHEVVMHDDTQSARATDVSLAVLPVIARRGTVALEAGLRAGVSWYHLDVVPAGMASGRELFVSAPIRIEVDVTSWMSLHAAAEVELLSLQPGLTRFAPLVASGGQYVGGFTIWF